jgi:hypothetical protein
MAPTPSRTRTASRLLGSAVYGVRQATRRLLDPAGAVSHEELPAAGGSLWNSPVSWLIAPPRWPRAWKSTPGANVFWDLQGGNPALRVATASRQLTELSHVLESADHAARRATPRSVSLSPIRPRVAEDDDAFVSRGTSGRAHRSSGVGDPPEAVQLVGDALHALVGAFVHVVSRLDRLGRAW